jgi:hypothetical protein
MHFTLLWPDAEMKIFIRPHHEPEWHEKDYIGHPEPVPLEEYARQRAACIDHLAALAPEVEIYDYGVIGTPGISDIDLICFVADERKAAIKAAVEKVSFGSLFVHPPVILPKSSRNDMRWLFPISEFKALRLPENAKSLPPVLSGATLADLALLDSFNSAVVRWKGLSRRLAQPEVNVRQTMLSIWSARYTIETAYLAGLERSAKWDGFADAAFAQRKSWRNDQTVAHDELNRLTNSVKTVMEEIAEASASKLLERIDLPHSSASLSCGRSMFSPCDSVAENWNVKFLKVKLGRTPKLYCQYFLPRTVYDLLFWDGHGDESLAHVAERRGHVANKSAMNDSTVGKSRPLMARLLDDKAATLQKRILDYAILQYFRKLLRN